ncbi:MAG: antibiotic biosynthesis monooxygenase [Solirubrobacteraceae bacterium]
MKVARVATSDEPPTPQDDDERRVASLRETVSACPGFVAGYHLRDETSGRWMSITVWESDEAMTAGEETVRNRPASDQRGIRPSRIERWVVDGAF